MKQLSSPRQMQRTRLSLTTDPSVGSLARPDPTSARVQVGGWDGIMGGAAQHSAADRFASASTSDVAAAFATPEIRVRRVGGWARTRFSAPVHITGYVQLARRNGTATGRGSWLPAADACMCRPTSNDELNRKFVFLPPVVNVTRAMFFSLSTAS